MSNREPKVHVIDGVTYVEVERKAEVGEKVIVISPAIGRGWYNGKVGDIFEVIDGSEYGFIGETLESGDIYVENGGNSNGICAYISRNNYRVLDPIETKASPQITDILANLARRVSSLEQQLRDTQGNCEKLAEELANAKYNAKRHIESLTCNIITLDERSQVLNAINKFYEEGNR